MCLAVPGKIETIEGDDPLIRRVRVNFGGIVKEVSLSCSKKVATAELTLTAMA